MLFYYQTKFKQNSVHFQYSTNLGHFIQNKLKFLKLFLSFPDLGTSVAEGSLTTVVTVEEGRVDMPCDISAPSLGDSVYLVLWYRKHSGTPIYRYKFHIKSYPTLRLPRPCCQIHLTEN